MKKTRAIKQSIILDVYVTFSIFDFKKQLFSAYYKEGARQHDCIQPCTFMRIQYGYPFSETHSTNKTGEQTLSKGEAWACIIKLFMAVVNTVS
jgi:hypothetical protein